MVTFLDLPPEIRRMIYTSLYAGEHPRISPTAPKGPGIGSLLHVTHPLIYSESLPVIYGSVNFLLTGTAKDSKWISALVRSPASG